MEEKYSDPQAIFISPIYMLFALIATIILGVGFFCFFVPLDVTERLFGDLAKPLNEYAMHLMVVAVALYMFNAYTAYKRAKKARQ